MVGCNQIRDTRKLRSTKMAEIFGGKAIAGVGCIDKGRTDPELFPMIVEIKVEETIRCSISIDRTHLFLVVLQ